jgi:Icc protein
LEGYLSVRLTCNKPIIPGSKEEPKAAPALKLFRGADLQLELIDTSGRYQCYKQVAANLIFYFTHMRHLYLHSKLRWFIFLFLSLGLHSCEVFEFSPHEVLLRDKDKERNQHYTEQIQALGLQPDDTIRIALISDTQRFYDETEDVVSAINTRSAGKNQRIHFVIHGGDITDFGLTDEFRWIHDRLKKFKMPYLTVIGNHDCVANGKVIYQKLYGAHDYRITVAGNRFVFLNTNSLEYKTDVPPNLGYLQEALADVNNYQNAFVVSHVPPFDNDFDKSKEAGFAQLMRQYDVRYSIHGHQHRHQLRQPYADGKDYLVIGSVENRVYVVLTIIGRQVSYEVVNF